MAPSFQVGIIRFRDPLAALLFCSLLASLSCSVSTEQNMASHRVLESMERLTRNLGRYRVCSVDELQSYPQPSFVKYEKNVGQLTGRSGRSKVSERDRVKSNI